MVQKDEHSDVKWMADALDEEHVGVVKIDSPLPPLTLLAHHSCLLLLVESIRHNPDVHA